ncbi:MAG: peptide deformylase [Clostridia bacterium]|nr:peptide deformylase [Clostridia bacterium]
MALRKIVYIEDELLRKKSRPVEKFDEKLHKLLDDMAETMYHANGVGLAAPQVAVLRRVVVMDCGDGLIEMVNPEILETEGEQDGAEGCLSVPGRRGMVKRPMKVRARFQDRNGEWYEIEAEELLARCIMHETDHLDGQLYVDIMSREIFEDEEEEAEEDGE